MAWEYLQQPEMDRRYVSASRNIDDNDYVVDVNSGNSRLRNYVNNYYSNDLYFSEADEKCTDHEFIEKVEKCDILCCFGIGGHEITKEPLESPTLTATLITLANKFKPKRMILECIERFNPIVYSILTSTNYHVVEGIADTYDLDVPDNLKYVTKRNIFICEYKGA